jgi:polyisoprenoid-binding protein YceI
MAAALLIAGCSQATDAAPKAATSAAAPAMERIGNWEVVKADSHIKFTATQQGESFTGEFPNYRVLINFKEDALDKANVTAAIDLGSVKAGNKDRDGALPGKDWFSVKAFPEAVFQSNDFVKTGEGTYEARGTLSIKGKSQPLTLPFTLDIDGAKAEMTGQVTLDRTLWEVGSGSWASDEQVGTEVTVDIKISAQNPF